MIHSCACVKGGFNVAIEQINAAIEHPGVWIFFFRSHPRGGFSNLIPEVCGGERLQTVSKARAVGDFEASIWNNVCVGTNSYSSSHESLIWSTPSSSVVPTCSRCRGFESQSDVELINCIQVDQIMSAWKKVCS